MRDDDAKKISAHEVGMALDSLSVDELHERIALLHGEIARLQAAIDSKTASRSAAESVFKF